MSELKKLQSESKEIQNLKDLNESIGYEEFLTRVKNNPNILRKSNQLVLDMILSYGTEKRVNTDGDEYTHYKFFDDPDNGGKNAVFGIDSSLQKVMQYLKNAARGLGNEKRMALLHGPVGAAKSSIATQMKRGLEKYTATDEGLIYTYSWVDPKGLGPLSEEAHDEPITEMPAPLQACPFLLLPLDQRKAFLETVNTENCNHNPKALMTESKLNPKCQLFLDYYLEKYDYDLSQVLENHIEVKRLVLSESKRKGIGTFQPKDEKNQDSTELTGDINYGKIAIYGADSDPRAFNFDGELCVANRGIIEFIEILKLETAFLYELLTATQEKVIKPKKFSHIDIDFFILGHTNEPEFRKLQNNEFMEALRDRTIKIDVPYILKLDDEVKIYQKDYSKKDVPLHMAPHTITAAGMFSILTRLEEDPAGELEPLEKLDFYNGKTVRDKSTKDLVEYQKNNTKREGLEGISPRFIQDKISNTIVQYDHHGCVSPFALLKEIEDGLKHHGGITSQEQMDKYKAAVETVRDQVGTLIKEDVHRAMFSDDEQALRSLASKYIENVKAYQNGQKIRDNFTKRSVDPDENFMRSVEDKIKIPNSRKDDFRTEIMNFIGSLSIEGKEFTYKSHDKLREALREKLIEDSSNKIQLTNHFTDVMDRENQDKIDVIKTRLVEKFDYCEKCANEALQVTANILNKGKDGRKS